MSACACRVNIYARTREQISAVPHAYTLSNPVSTHWGWVAHICVSILTIIWFRWWPAAWLASSHYPSQCWNIIIIRTSEANSVKSSAKFVHFRSRKCICNCRLGKVVQIVSASMGWVTMISDIREYAHPIYNTRDFVLSALCSHTGCFCLKGVVYEFCKYILDIWIRTKNTKA